MIYAIGEILLVVIGVLIALNINNNNELKKNGQSITSSLKEIQSNLLDDIVDLKRQIVVTEKQANLLLTLKTYDFTIEEIERDAYRTKKQEIKSKFKNYIALLKEDIEITKRELAEDIRESKEDGRERRDDREERNEPEVNRKRNRG